MEKEFVSYEMALALKELGFNEPCFTYYYNVSGKLRTNISVDTNNGWTYFPNKKSIILAPTFSQAFRFFSENHGLDYSIIPYSEFIENNSLKIFNAVIYRYYKNMNVQAEIIRIDGEIATFVNKNQLELMLLQKMIETIKNK
jgi:hypothetical protein